MRDDSPAIRTRQVDADAVLAMLEAEPHDTPDTFEGAPGERDRAIAELPVLAFRSRTEAGRTTWLIRDAALVQQVLADPVHYTNEPYAEIGGGNFMLAMDGLAHDAQRRWVQAQLFPPHLSLHVEALAALSIEEACVLPLKTGRFDAADLAGQAALRFTARLFGFAQADHLLLWQAMQYVYAGLVHQIVGRHVNLDPSLAWHRNPSSRLRERVKQLIDDHRFLRETAGQTAAVTGLVFGALDDETARRRATLQREAEVLKADIACRSGQADVDFIALCARFDSTFGSTAAAGAPGSEDARADIVIALMGGIVGNVQTSVAIVIDQLLAGPVPQWQAARRQAQTIRAANKTPPETPLLQTIRSILAAHPPVAFVPRRVASAGPVTLGGLTLSPGTDLILGLRPVGQQPRAAVDPALRIFAAGSRHDCIGRYIAEPLLARIAAELISLPGLDFVLDPIELRAQRLQRRWGFSARPFWLQHSRDVRLVQQPLRAVMDIREPVALHAAALERVIACAAPVIEASLRESRHIHFAWFMLIEGGRKLALFTVYDGNFEAYIEYFTGRVGPLFDRLFAHVLDGTKPPVHQRPKDFVARIGKVNAMHLPVANYFFSAYPTLSVADVLHGDAGWRSRGLPLGRSQRDTGPTDPATQAFRDAATLRLKSAEFDLVALARDAAVRYAGRLLGFDRVLAWLAAAQQRAAAGQPPLGGMNAAAFASLMSDVQLIAEIDPLLATPAAGHPPDPGAPEPLLEILLDPVPALAAQQVSAKLARHAEQPGADDADLLARIAALPGPARELLDAIVDGVSRWPGLDFASSADARAPHVPTATATTAISSLRLRHARDLSLMQQPLCVVMNVRAPFAQHAAALQTIIQAGAPAVERSLGDSRQVHFAWFQLLEEGRKLALFSVCDGDVDASIGFLARDAGELFDTLFDHLETPPPRPVRQHPQAWVEHVRAYHRPPYAGYFFSACADTRVADIGHAQRGRREATVIAPPDGPAPRIGPEPAAPPAAAPPNNPPTPLGEPIAMEAT